MKTRKGAKQEFEIFGEKTLNENQTRGPHSRHS